MEHVLAMHDPDSARQLDYDVIIVGGALSGAATAIMVLRQNPGARVLIVEKGVKHGRRVGEATVEVSGYFLCRVLDLTKHLNECHLVKQGLRFWFANEKVSALDQASEVGAKYLSRIPSFQIDRAVFDEEVLRRACEAGAVLMRPATVSNVRLQSGGVQLLDVTNSDVTTTLRTRWVVDATGVAAMLARKNGWWTPNPDHPTSSCWSRWKGVKDWDSRALAEKYPQWSKCVYGMRNTATNHIIGDGWWSWWIPLKGGDVSVGFVLDQRLVDFPQDGTRLGERLKSFLMKHPVAAEMLEHAECDDSDVHWRKNLAYQSSTFAGDGFALVGDAAAFMDPFYSPGMDWITFTTCAVASLITAQRHGKPMAELIARHNRDFTVSCQRWFDALYRDKYDYIGEFDLLSLAFHMDLSLYYWGVVEVPFNQGEEKLTVPPFSPPSGRFFAALMSTYNRRFAQIARRRRRLGLLGRSNDRQRFLIPGFTLNRSDTLRIFPMLAQWAWLELTEGWKSWFEKPEHVQQSRPTFQPATPSPAPIPS